MSCDVGSCESNKRAKLSLDIGNLPDSVLLHTTEYLHDMTKVLLAVALTASSATWREKLWKIKPSKSALVILNAGNIENFGSSIDLKDVDSIQALWFDKSLTDEDIGAVLTCVGAVHPIQTVKLTHCVAITGCGLDPLRGCTTLKQLDLSLVGRDDKPNLRSDPMISEYEVIPILDSILDANNCSLKHIQFPKKWREEKSPLLVEFLSKYNRVMNGRNIECGGWCDGGTCQGTEVRPWVNKSGNHFGINNFTCYGCQVSYCPECAENEEDLPLMERELVCEHCEKRYCTECIDTMKCDSCQKTTCYHCTMIGYCEACEKTTCDDCCPAFYCDVCCDTKCIDCVRHNFCDYPGCHASNCVDCETESLYCTKYCRTCGETYCGEHMMKMVVKYAILDEYCSSCTRRAALQLSDYNNSFENWVNELEEKYGRESVHRPLSEETFAEAMQRRESLRQRCHAVGSKLSFKQKMFEKFEQKLQGYESDLVL